MIERLQQDPAFAEQFVSDFLKLKDDNEALKNTVEKTKEKELEAQLALRQAKGFNLYLKGKETSQRKIDMERQASFRQAEEATIVLKITNQELRDRLDDAKRLEQEAKLAVRQARGITRYLKKKNASLEKQLEASKEEHLAKMALKELRTQKHSLKDTMKENGMKCSEHSRDLLSCDGSVSTADSFDVNDFEEFAELDHDPQSVPDELRIEMAAQQ